MFCNNQDAGLVNLAFKVDDVRGRSEVIFKKSSNLYCRLDLVRVLMVGTKVSKGFFV